jgi:predicted TIM-barrel fold metal-dependent hydrolase
MDNAGVDIGVAAYRAAWGDECNNRPAVDNDELLELVDNYPNRFIGVPCISPIYHTVEQVAAMTEKLIVKGPLRGWAMEPIIDRPAWFINDKRAMALYEIADQYKIPVMFTYSSMPFEDVAALKEIASTFKNVNFVLCHGGAPRVFEVIDIAFGFPNVYLSPDGNLINTAFARPIVDAANYMIRERVLFGSAHPLGDMEHAVSHYMYKSGLREEVLPDIMYNNAARLFGLEA